MARKNAKKARDPHYAPDELDRLTPEQKLGRIKVLEKDIDQAKGYKKATNAAANDTIKELEARKKEIIDSIPADFLGQPKSQSVTSQIDQSAPPPTNVVAMSNELEKQRELDSEG